MWQRAVLRAVYVIYFSEMSFSRLSTAPSTKYFASSASKNSYSASYGTQFLSGNSMCTATRWSPNSASEYVLIGRLMNSNILFACSDSHRCIAHRLCIIFVGTVNFIIGTLCYNLSYRVNPLQLVIMRLDRIPS